VLELLGDGAVKATSTTDDSLRQVARLVTFKIQPPASNTAVCFQYTHGLSTDHTHVTVMQDTTAPYGVVECDVRRGKHTTGTTAAGGGVTSGADNGYQSGGADNISILFSSAPANGTDYLVTIVG
jgi:hypothetical protein